MGIRKLIKYINTNNNYINLAQKESGNNIYISNIIYFDITYKLIEMYNKFMQSSSNINVDFDSKVNELLLYIESELLKLFNKLKKSNRIIYIFVDYKFMNNLKEHSVLFKDFLNINVNYHERVNSISMIKRKYLKLLDNTEDDYNTMKYLINKVRCMFELISIYSISNKLDIEKYISIPYLLKNEKDTKVCDKLNILLNEGRYRYLILRGGKYIVKKRRGKELFSFLNISNNPNQNEEQTKSFSDDDITKPITSIQSQRTYPFNMDKLLFNTISKNGYDKMNEFLNYVPFTIIIYMFPMIVKNINIENVKFYGCEIESDFAISKHIHIYSKNAFPTIFSNDTDMLCLMCDVDCTVKLSLKRDRRNIYKKIKFNNSSNSLTCFVNPILFWQDIFGCTLNPRIIKILCVLMGTDYNPYNSKSPIHIKWFEDILKILNIEKFEEIDEDILLTNIYIIMKNNENNIYCKQTAIALNIYLNELENGIHFITKNTNKNKINMSRFLKYSRRTAL